MDLLLDSASSYSSRNSTVEPPLSLLEAGKRHLDKRAKEYSNTCTVCSRCLADGFCMQCTHHLCLVCATRQLEVAKDEKGRKLFVFIRCHKCLVETVADEETIKTLQGEAARRRFLRHPSYRHGSQLQYFESYLVEEKRRDPQKMLQVHPPKSADAPCCFIPCENSFSANEMNQLGDSISLPASVHDAPQAVKSMIKTVEDATPVDSEVGDSSSQQDFALTIKKRNERDCAKDRMFALSDVLLKPNADKFIDLKTATTVSIACTSHRKYPAEYFCSTCSTGCICSHCIIYRFHDGHTIETVEDAWRDIRATAIDPWIVELESIAKDIEFTMEMLATKQKEWRSYTHANICSLTGTVTELKQQLLRNKESNEAFLKGCHNHVRLRAQTLRNAVEEDRKQCEAVAQSIRAERPLSNSTKLMRFFASNIERIQQHTRKQYAEAYTKPTEALSSILSSLGAITQTHTLYNTEITSDSIRKTALEFPRAI